MLAVVPGNLRCSFSFHVGIGDSEVSGERSPVWAACLLCSLSSLDFGRPLPVGSLSLPSPHPASFVTQMNTCSLLLLLLSLAEKEAMLRFLGHGTHEEGSEVAVGGS